MGAYVNESGHRTVTQTLFGKDLKSGKAWSIFALRVVLGFMFLWGGIQKIGKEMAGSYATSGFLSHAVSGPFQVVFNGMAGNPAVEYLLVYGELLIGISLVFGIVSRVGSIAGIPMVLLMYVSQLPAGAAGYGNYLNQLLQTDALFNEYILMALIFLAFIFLVPGRFLGLDGVLQNSSFVQRRPILSRIALTLG